MTRDHHRKAETPRPREIELKLDLPIAEAASIQRGSWNERFGAPLSTDRIVSVYFDTPDFDLRRHGLTLRVRSGPDGMVQTIKAHDGVSVGMFDRAEWEAPCADGEPDLDAAAETPVGPLLAEARDPLTRAFHTVVERTRWLVNTGESAIEIVLDDGEVVAAHRRERFREVELELKQGSGADVFAVARDLVASGPLRLGVLAKSERGYALSGAPEGSEGPELKAGLPTGDALARMVLNNLRDVLLAADAVVADREAEDLHKARVALRRLRSTVSVFKHVLADDRYETLKTDLRWISQQLGDARNLDVYLDQRFSGAAEAGNAEPGLTAYRAAVERKRERAYDTVVEALRSSRCRLLWVDLVAWITDGPWRQAAGDSREAERQAPIEAAAGAILDRLFDKVKSKGKHLDRLDDAKRHRLRIKAKKLRYLADDVAGLLKGKTRRHRHETFLATLKALQDRLGALHDVTTGHELATDLARELEADPDRQVLFAAGHITGEQDEHLPSLIEAAQKAHHALAKRFWKGWGG